MSNADNERHWKTIVIIVGLFFVISVRGFDEMKPEEKSLAINAS